MKYFITALLFLAFISCKKKTQDSDPTPVTQPQENFEYQGNLKENMILNKSSGGYDTSFFFEGLCIKVPSSGYTTSAHFSSSNLNGYTADASNNFNGTILNCPNYLNMANHSSWNVTSPDFGNFQYTDTFSIPKITGAVIIPATFDASHGIPIKILGIQNAGSVYVIDKGGVYFTDSDNQLISFQTQYVSTINDTIRNPNFSYMPANTTLTLSVIAGRTVETRINGHTTFILKGTIFDNIMVTKTN